MFANASGATGVTGSRGGVGEGEGGARKERDLDGAPPMKKNLVQHGPQTNAPPRPADSPTDRPPSGRHGLAKPTAYRQHQLAARRANRPATLRVRAEGGGVSTAADSFQIPAVPDLIPDGPWAKVPGGVCAAKGFRATGVYAGLRASGRKADLSLVVADQAAAAAGVFTLNVMCAAPVTYCKDVLAKKGSVRAVSRSVLLS